MPECIECGAKVAANESFCGGCGTQQPVTQTPPLESPGHLSDPLATTQADDGTEAEAEVVAQVSESDSEVDKNTGQLNQESEKSSDQPAPREIHQSAAAPRGFHLPLWVVLRLTKQRSPAHQCSS